MTLKQIEYYEAVCRTGNVTAAAQQLYVSRSVISRAMQELEDELDVQLFLRGRNGVELTDYGKTLHNLFSQFEGFYTALLTQIGNLKERPDDYSLTVGLAISCWGSFPVEVYEEFREKYPHIKISALELSSYDAFKKLNDGSIDVVITPMNLKEQSDALESVYIYDTASVFCTPLDDPLVQKGSVTYQDIRQKPIAALNYKLPVDWPLQVRLRTNAGNLIHQMVAKGILYAFLPTDLARNWDDIAMLPFDPPQCNPMKAVWNKNLPHSSALKDFVSFLQEYFAKSADAPDNK